MINPKKEGNYLLGGTRRYVLGETVGAYQLSFSEGHEDAEGLVCGIDFDEAPDEFTKKVIELKNKAMNAAEIGVLMEHEPTLLSQADNDFIWIYCGLHEGMIDYTPNIFEVHIWVKTDDSGDTPDNGLDYVYFKFPDKMDLMNIVPLVASVTSDSGLAEMPEKERSKKIAQDVFGVLREYAGV